MDLTLIMKAGKSQFFLAEALAFSFSLLLYRAAQAYKNRSR